MRVEPSAWEDLMTQLQVGDLVRALQVGELGVGVVDAVHGDRVLIRLTIKSSEAWTSPLTGGTFPPRCPRTYLLWMDAGAAQPLNAAN